MDSASFELPVQYKGKELLFPANLVSFGYSYQIKVDIEGEIILFERDEERNLRAVLPFNSDLNRKEISPDLIAAVADALVDAFE